MVLPALFQDNLLPEAELPAGQGLEAIADPGNRSATVDMKMCPQCVSNWCWAAVAVSVTRLLYPGSTWTQCLLATRVFFTEGLRPPDCCVESNKSTSDCNHEAGLDLALYTTGALANTKAQTPPDGDTLYTELSNGRPVACQVNWIGTTENHFVAIVGYHRVGTDERVDILDPAYPPTTGVLLNSFLNNYCPLNSPTSASWKTTYFTQKPAVDTNLSGP